MPFVDQHRQTQLPSLTTLSWVGLSGIVAVTAQTLSLSWISNLVNLQAASGLTTFQIFKNIITSNQALILYRGQMARFRHSALARCGDMVSNYSVIRFFQTHTQQQIRNTPICFQTALSWLVASGWRVGLLPLDLLQNKSVWPRPSWYRVLAKLDSIKERRWRSDMVPLYSWLVVQNYLMAYTQPIEYSSDRLGAVARNSAIGFASMSSYQIYRSATQLWRAECYTSTNFTKHMRQISLKGMHGIVFCNVTQMVKQYFQVAQS